MADQVFNLLDEALGVNGIEPMEMTIGQYDFLLRRSYTGLQIIEWTRIEDQRLQDVNLVLDDKETDDAQKEELLNSIVEEYAARLLKALTVDADEESIHGAAKLITSIPVSARNRVFRALGVNAGITDAEGNPLPFTSPSKTKGSTDD